VETRTEEAVMAITERRLATAEELQRLYESSPDAVETRPARDLTRPIVTVSDAGARRLLIAWVAVLGIIFVFEPTPADADAAIPLWADLAATGFVLSFFGTMVGLATRRPWGIGASLAAVGFGGVLAVACAATGHHVGAWWLYELIAFAGLGALTVGALRRA
jgi:hypothetical protein